MRFFYLTLSLITTVLTSIASSNIRVAESLARRVVPELADRIQFREITAEVDSFAVSDSNGTIVIEGTSPIAMSVGLNNYLRSIGTNVSWHVDRPVVVPSELPRLTEAITGKAVVPDRFFLNYCTFGYTMPFWQWRDWERFIDWMALNGINMPLAMTGQEKTWFETWQQLGLAENDILKSFTGPAHLPWHWMANIDHYQGPLSLNWLNKSEELQKKILARERELGMRTVMPAFAGHVPAALRDLYPDAKITLRQKWCGFKGEDSSYFLDPSDPLYARIQKTFLALQDSIYGSDHIYGIDPFNEIDSPDWSEDFLRNVSANIYATLLDVDPKARWLNMTWTFYNDSEHWTKPRIKAFLEGVPDDGLILLDYYCEVQPVWKITDSYFGKPYILCYLGNFGANTMIIGNLRDVNDKINDFLTNGGDATTGIGGTLEGLDMNPYMHEFVLAKAWRPELTPESWTDLWAQSRGGLQCEAIHEAWKMLNDKVYVSHSKNGQGGMTNLRPMLRKNRINCADATIAYDNADLLRVLDILLSAKGCDSIPAYRFDVMNVTRQAMANQFMTLRNRLADAYFNNNADSVAFVSDMMDSLLVDLDRLMATDPDTSMKKWIENARSYGVTKAESDALETNARSIVTLWGYPGTVLNDYANRHWSGLIDSFYRKRWQLFTTSILEHMREGIAFDEDKFHTEILEFEEEWTNALEPVGEITEENPVNLAKLFRSKPYFNLDD